MLLTDALIWATLLFIAIGGAAAVALGAVWMLTLPAAGGRISQETARRTYRRILWAAVGLFVVLFVGGGIAGLLQ
jgi:hypothetical protein